MNEICIPIFGRMALASDVGVPLITGCGGGADSTEREASASSTSSALSTTAAAAPDYLNAFLDARVAR